MSEHNDSCGQNDLDIYHEVTGWVLNENGCWVNERLNRTLTPLPASPRPQKPGKFFRNITWKDSHSNDDWSEEDLGKAKRHAVLYAELKALRVEVYDLKKQVEEHEAPKIALVDDSEYEPLSEENPVCYVSLWLNKVTEARRARRRMNYVIGD